MTRPQPKAEIVIQRLPRNRSMHIYTASQDARIWCERELPAYGRLDVFTRHLSFEVVPIFDIEDVIVFVVAAFDGKCIVLAPEDTGEPILRNEP